MFQANNLRSQILLNYYHIRDRLHASKAVGKVTGYRKEYHMLIRWAVEKDLPAWYTLATEVSEIFQHPVDMGAELVTKSSGRGTVSRYEMLTAVDYMSGSNMGFICFSRTD